MWLILKRAPVPDAPYWPGRRLLAVLDAVAWPVGWIAAALHIPMSQGLILHVIVAGAAWQAMKRVYQAMFANQRYHFSTWRWGRALAAMVMFGLLLKAVALLLSR